MQTSADQHTKSTDTMTTSTFPSARALGMFIAMLSVVVAAGTVSAQPTWTVNPADFANATYVIAQIEIDGTASDDAGNIAGAFVGLDTRGVATATDVGGEKLFFLTVYCETASGETVTFQVWDDAAGETKTATETLECVDGALNGSIATPFVLSIAGAGGDPGPDWNVDPADFQFNMQVIAELHIDGVRSDNLGNEVAAFDDAGTEIRGVATPIEFGGQAVYLLTIFGATDGETITFKAYDAAADEVKDVAETLEFHDSQVEGSLGSPLVLNVGSTTNEPNWSVDPTDFESDMQVIGVIHVDNVLSNDAGNIIGAFAGSEVRGVATPVDVDGTMTFFLTIYSDTEEEKITFKAYDAANDLVRVVAEVLFFAANETTGSTGDPFIWHVGELTQTCTLGAGWNWFSVNVTPGDPALDAVLAGLNPSEGDIVKNPDESVFSVWDGTEWEGSLLEVDPADGYKIRITDPGTFTNTGEPVAFALSVLSGWNLIGFAPQSEQDIALTLGSLPLETGDLIKSDDGSVSEYNGGWLGTLTTLEPCEGYMLRVEHAGDLSFIAAPPADGAESASAAVAAMDVNPARTTTASREVHPAHTTTASMDVDPARFEHTMNVIGVSSLPKAGVIAAYAGSELRGMANPLQINGQTYFFLTVHGSVAEENIAFMAIDEDGTTRELQGTLDFSADAVHGSLRDPVQWVAVSSVGAEDEALPKAYALERNYPNPFNPSTTIDFALPEAGSVRLVIYDVTGRAVRTLVNGPRAAGRHSVRWNALDDAGRHVASGVYVYRIQAGNYESAKTLVLMK